MTIENRDSVRVIKDLAELSSIGVGKVKGNEVNKHFANADTIIKLDTGREMLLYVYSGDVSVDGDVVYLVPDEKPYYYINSSIELKFYLDTVYFILDAGGKK